MYRDATFTLDINEHEIVLDTNEHEIVLDINEHKTHWKSKSICAPACGRGIGTCWVNRLEVQSCCDDTLSARLGVAVSEQIASASISLGLVFPRVSSLSSLRTCVDPGTANTIENYATDS